MTRTLHVSGIAISLILSGLLSALPAAAQEETATTPPPAPPAEHEGVMAKVIDVKGDVHYAPLETREWKPCQVGDEYPPETMIRTGIRSSAKLQIGDEEPYSVVVIESASRTIIAEAYKTKDTKHVRIGVGYGGIRAGVAEGGLKSDFTVDSPVATLSKRGTWDFGMFYERGTDRFEVFLLDRGLVEAINEITGERRGLLPKEAVTGAMRRWGDEAQVRRNVPIPDLLGHGDIDVVFNRLREDGLGVTDPASGKSVLDLSTSFAQDEFARMLRGRLPALPVRMGERQLTRPEGFFGTGRGDQLVDVVIEANNPLAQQGLARPGNYKFRRSAVQGWLRQHDRRR